MSPGRGVRTPLSPLEVGSVCVCRSREGGRVRAGKMRQEEEWPWAGHGHGQQGLWPTRTSHRAEWGPGGLCWSSTMITRPLGLGNSHEQRRGHPPTCARWPGWVGGPPKGRNPVSTAGAARPLGTALHGHSRGQREGEEASPRESPCLPSLTKCSSF